MVLGIVGTVLCCLPLAGPICGTMAIIFYAKFNTAYRASGGALGGKGLAIAGLVCGIVGAAIGALYTIYWIAFGLIIGGASRGLSPFVR